MKTRFALAVILGVLLTASGTVAQETGRHEIAVQGTGLFTQDSNGHGVQQHATDTGGFLVSYRYHINEWFAADGSYGYGRNTQENFTLAGPKNVQSDIHEFTGALVVTIPRSVFRLNPYVLAGTGALDFRPTNNFGGYVAGAQSQVKPVFLYGGGANYDLTRHFMLRAEYRGFVFGRPDFTLHTLHSGSTAHIAQPSAGIVFRF